MRSNISEFDSEYVSHILLECQFLQSKSEKIKLADFLKDEVLQRAFSRSLEIIGEAVKKISSEYKTAHPEIEWKKIAGTRDKIIHDYIGVDFEILWDVIQTKIPSLITSLDLL